jgi:tetratricopeptide (TPR) repeat protein
MDFRCPPQLDAFYETDWQQASTIFSELQSARPDDSRAYFFSAMIPFWSYYFGESTQEAANTFLERSQKAITISEKQLEADPRDTTMVLMLSGLYGYQSLVAASENEYRTAIKSGMTGFKFTRQLLSIDSDDPKALIGKGMFYYMVGSVPNGLKWVTNMIGFSGDMQEGFSALEKAAASDSYVSNDAKMILAYLYEREEQPRKALSYLQELTAKHPKNVIFKYNKARLLEKCNRPAEARDTYRQVVSMETVALQSLKEKSRSRLQHL